MTETELLHAFMRAAPHALPDVRVFRRNVLNVTTNRGQHVRNGIPGMADAYALHRGGLHVEIEAKSATGRLRPEQVRWQAFCARFAIPHLVLSALPSEPPDATVARWVDALRTCIECHRP